MTATHTTAHKIERSRGERTLCLCSKLLCNKRTHSPDGVLSPFRYYRYFLLWFDCPTRCLTRKQHIPPKDMPLRTDWQCSFDQGIEPSAPTGCPREQKNAPSLRFYMGIWHGFPDESDFVLEVDSKPLQNGQPHLLGQGQYIGCGGAAEVDDHVGVLLVNTCPTDAK